jgi:hypothetical protein
MLLDAAVCTQRDGDPVGAAHAPRGDVRSRACADEYGPLYPNPMCLTRVPAGVTARSRKAAYAKLHPISLADTPGDTRFFRER